MDYSKEALLNKVYEIHKDKKFSVYANDREYEVKINVFLPARLQGIIQQEEKQNKQPTDGNKEKLRLTAPEDDQPHVCCSNGDARNEHL